MSGLVRAIAMNELRATLRSPRTAWQCVGLTTLLGMVLAAVGATASRRLDSADVGNTVFHAFFCGAQLILGTVGAGLGVRAVARERQLGTWDLYALCHVPKRSLMWGKALGTSLALGIYYVVLFPIGCLPLAFGGVELSALALAYVTLAATSAWCALLGLKVGTSTSSPTLGWIGATSLAFAASVVGLLGFGFGGSFAAGARWTLPLEGAPIWHPLALARVPHQADYWTLLVAAPLVSLGALIWLTFELSLVGAMDPPRRDQRGVVVWSSVMLPALAVVAGSCGLVVSHRYWIGAGWAMLVSSTVCVATVFTLASGPVTPSHSTPPHGSSIPPTRRSGLLGSSQWLLRLTVGVLCGVVGIALLAELPVSENTLPRRSIASLLTLGCYLGGYATFLTGLLVWVRGQASASAARLLVAMAAVVTAVAPWGLRLTLSGLGAPSVWQNLVAAPSPGFLVGALAAIQKSADTATTATVCANLAGTAWALLGLLALRSARLHQSGLRRSLGIEAPRPRAPEAE